MSERMRFAYADPPYLGCCGKFYEHYHGADGRCWDDLETHALLVARLEDEYPDGWALSLTSGSLRSILPLCPETVRVAAWVKPFHAYKKGVRPAYAWEPVIFHRGRQIAIAPPKGGAAVTPKDFVAANITLRRGFTGAKPVEFTYWLLDLLGVEPDDEFHDLFPGSGAVTAAHQRWLNARPFDFGAA